MVFRLDTCKTEFMLLMPLLMPLDDGGMIFGSFDLSCGIFITPNLE